MQVQYLSASCSSSCSCSRAQGPKSKWVPEPSVTPSWGSARCAPSPSLGWAEEGVEPAHINKKESYQERIVCADALRSRLFGFERR